MRFRTLVIAFCLFACGAFGQTAKVIQLSPEDAAKSKQVHEAALKAQKAVEDFDQHVRETYTQCSHKDCNLRGYLIIGGIEYKDGWDGGIEYSEDWQFIVPKRVATTGAFTISNLGTCPNIYMAPAGTAGTAVPGGLITSITSVQ